MIPKPSAFWMSCLAQYKKFVAAARFLSILPLPGGKRLFADHKESSSLIGGEYFPLVGLLLSGLLSSLVLLVGPAAPRLVLAALLVVALVVLTGGLHLDGLMDSCDGLFGGQTRERKLEIMRDSRVGSFGVLAGVSALLLKFTCLASLGTGSLPLALCLVLPSARWSLVLALRLFPSARSGGLGEIFRREITWQRQMLACIISLAIVLVSAQLTGLMIWCVITATALLAGAWITRLIGGLTGDTCGAIAEVAEVAGLLAFILMHA